MPAPALRTGDLLTTEAARTLLLDAQGLLADPAGPATPGRVARAIARMGFVQVDTINVVERAHHHILQTRFDAYRPATLTRLLERDRRLFEHWTHDASIIPTDFYRHWRPRFDRWREHCTRPGSRWAQRMADEPVRVMRAVKRRIEREGPLMSRDFEDPRETRKGWWDWKPQKAALEALWRSGELAIHGRVNFHKVYDLASRALPHCCGQEPPDELEHVEWACRSALERLGAATPTEIARFWLAVPGSEVRAWCERAARRGDVEALQEDAAEGGRARRVFALPDWRRRLRRAPAPPDRMRLLSPFDPVLRDRDRMLRLFGFEYRFEAFVPAARRRYGYYVLPILDGDRLVGRLDPKLHRDASTLEVRRVWWEPGSRRTRARARRLAEAVDRLAHQLGAERFSLPRDA